MIRFLIGVFALVSLSAPIRAEKAADDLIPIYMTGEMLTQTCRAYLEFIRNGQRGTAQQAHDAAMCFGFVEGVHDAERFRGWTALPEAGSPAACIPKDVNANSLAEIVAMFVDQNPAHRTLSGYSLVKVALARSYPCQK